MGGKSVQGGGSPAHTPTADAVLWECQIDVADQEGDLTISRVTIEASDARDAIRHCCAGLDNYTIERVEVRRV